MLNAQQWHTIIEVRVPAAKRMPRKVGNLLLVNNTTRQPDDWGHWYIQSSSAHQMEYSTEKCPVYCLFGLQQAFDDSECFDAISILDRTENNSSQPFSKELLTHQKVDSLCRLYDTEAVMSLDQLLVNDVSELYQTAHGTFYAYLQVVEFTSWSVTYTDGKTIQHTQNDTLLWEAEQDTPEKAIAALPERQQAAEDMAMYVGELVGKLFTPQWQKRDRYFYENNDANISKGMYEYAHTHFRQAALLWKQAAETTGNNRKAKQTRAYAYANLAALYESEGDISSAIDYARKAFDAFNVLPTGEGRQQTVNMYHYIEELKTETKR